MNVLDRFFSNPHFYSSTVLAKIAVNGASIIWSLIVLFKRGALASTSYHYVANWVHEDVIAALFLSIASAQTVCLILHGRPRWFSYTGYFAMMVGWGAVFLAVVLHDGPVQPTSISATAVVFFLAAYAFLAMPKEVCRANDVL